MIQYRRDLCIEEIFALFLLRLFSWSARAIECACVLLIPLVNMVSRFEKQNQRMHYCKLHTQEKHHYTLILDLTTTKVRISPEPVEWEQSSSSSSDTQIYLAHHFAIYLKIAGDLLLARSRQPICSVPRRSRLPVHAGTDALIHSLTAGALVFFHHY